MRKRLTLFVLALVLCVSGAIFAVGCTKDPVFYDVTYYAENGVDVLATKQVEEGKTATDAIDGVEQKAGYTVVWNDATGAAYDFTAAVNGATSLYLSYVANTDTAYKVEHYVENVNGKYDLADTDNLTGTTATSVTATAKTYEGCYNDASNKSAVATATVKGDGSTVLKLYYARNEYKVYFYNGTKKLDTEEVKHGLAVEPTKKKVADIVDNVLTKKVFKHWSLTENGEAYDFNTLITAETSLYAVFDTVEREYAVTVDTTGAEGYWTLTNEGGAALTNVTVTAGSNFKFKVALGEEGKAVKAVKVTVGNDIEDTEATTTLTATDGVYTVAVTGETTINVEVEGYTYDAVVNYEIEVSTYDKAWAAPSTNPADYKLIAENTVTNTTMEFVPGALNGKIEFAVPAGTYKLYIVRVFGEEQFVVSDELTFTINKAINEANNATVGGGSNNDSETPGGSDAETPGGSANESLGGGSSEERPGGSANESIGTRGGASDSIGTRPSGGSASDSIGTRPSGGSANESLGGGSANESLGGGSANESLGGGSSEERPGGSANESLGGGSSEEAPGGNSGAETPGGNTGAETPAKPNVVEGTLTVRPIPFSAFNNAIYTEDNRIKSANGIEFNAIFAGFNPGTADFAVTATYEQVVSVNSYPADTANYAFDPTIGFDFNGEGNGVGLYTMGEGTGRINVDFKWDWDGGYTYDAGRLLAGAGAIFGFVDWGDCYRHAELTYVKTGGWMYVIISANGDAGYRANGTIVTPTVARKYVDELLYVIDIENGVVYFKQNVLTGKYSKFENANLTGALTNVKSAGFTMLPGGKPVNVNAYGYGYTLDADVIAGYAAQFADRKAEIVTNANNANATTYKNVNGNGLHVLNNGDIKNVRTTGAQLDTAIANANNELVTFTPMSDTLEFQFTITNANEDNWPMAGFFIQDTVTGGMVRVMWVSAGDQVLMTTKSDYESRLWMGDAGAPWTWFGGNCFLKDAAGNNIGGVDYYTWQKGKPYHNEYALTVKVVISQYNMNMYVQTSETKKANPNAWATVCENFNFYTHFSKATSGQNPSFADYKARNEEGKTTKQWVADFYKIANPCAFGVSSRIDPTNDVNSRLANQPIFGDITYKITKPGSGAETPGGGNGGSDVDGPAGGGAEDGPAGGNTDGPAGGAEDGPAGGAEERPGGSANESLRG